MPARLRDDHANARFLADGLEEIRGIRLDAKKVQTNIVVFDISGTGRNSAEFARQLAERNVLANGIDPVTMRIVTHMDVDRAACEQALAAIRAVCGKN